MSDSTSTVAFLTNLGGGGQIVPVERLVERLSNRHRSVGREEGNDFSSSSPPGN